MILINPHMEILYIRKIKGLWDPTRSPFWLMLCSVHLSLLILLRSALQFWSPATPELCDLRQVCFTLPTLRFFFCETEIWYGIYGAGGVCWDWNEKMLWEVVKLLGPMLCFRETELVEQTQLLLAWRGADYPLLLWIPLFFGFHVN